MAALNEESVEQKLKKVTNTQDSIESLSMWIIHHKTNHTKIVELWMKVLKRSVHPSHRLTLFYLCNDVVQNCKRKKAQIYIPTFKEQLPEAARLVRDLTVKNKIERIFKIWQERGVYEATFISGLITVLSGKPMPANANDPISPAATPIYEPAAEVSNTDNETSENAQEDDIDESTRILAEFKPHEMIDQITAYRRQDLEIQIKAKQLSHLRLDASSLEAVKQLKDRAHGNEFSSQFEDSCTKLEDLVKRQTEHLADQKALLETLNTSETFYEAQYREARIVANAYKNFGARINNMKKKLDELKKTMPKPESPIPSPDINAPSPENSPPFVGRPGYEYNSQNPLLGFKPTNHNAWHLNGQDKFGDMSNNLNNTNQDSPPLEAPSPEGSPTDLNLDESKSVNTSLDSRLASFMDRSHRTIETSRPQPVYTPPIATSHSKLSSLSRPLDDGNNTPLDDEAPTTPVQDEYNSPPHKKSSPPKRENPIDFLSRLISQTQKTPTTKTGAASFLDSLTMLGSGNKSQTAKVSSASEADSRNESMATSPQQQSQIPPWSTWNSTEQNRNMVTAVSGQFSSNTSPQSQPTSPTTSFPHPIPTMVPPPPIPPMGLVPPSPSTPISINLSIPPPPPPPFALVGGSSMNFSSPPPPPPPFQQTSPGQKENWPEKGPVLLPDPSNGNRSIVSNSVLMDLMPSKDFDQGVGGLPPEGKAISDGAMDIVSDEEEELDALMEDSEPEMEMDGPDEFASKLKQKTSSVGADSNPIVITDNSERPSMMTLPVSDGEDEIMADDNSRMDGSEGSSQHTSSKSHKKKSRSRSRSREKIHKHKKKKKHKRKGSDYEEYEEDTRTVKKISGRSSSRGSKDGKYDKYDGKYDDSRYTSDRSKYDKYDDRKHGSSKSGDYKSSYAFKDSHDPRSVEAYTQAFIQQFNQGSLGSGYRGDVGRVDPRRSSYSKYTN